MCKEVLIYHFWQVGLCEHWVRHSAPNSSAFEWKNKTKISSKLLNTEWQFNDNVGFDPNSFPT